MTENASMKKIQEEREVASVAAPSVGTLRDIQQLRAGTAVSIAELRDFLAQLKGRRPQEVIGIVSASLLVQSLSLASLLVVAVLVIFTLGPYLLYGPPQPKQATQKKSPAAVASDAAVAPPSPVPAAEPAANSATPATPNLERASRVMGLDEAKPADPQKNPLDSPNLDKLLDGIDR
jgi:pyruvate/2-oxoglutarate dehydrogenase complex dihydrolipoamide acyltransferase (E2) component